MASTLKLGKGNWGVKEDSLLAYSDQNNNFIPLPFDFSRASSATVVNKAGLIESVTSGLPRIDFSDDTNGALLLEPQSTNLITQSELFSDSYWTKSGSSVVSGFTSPDGLSSAYSLIEDTSLGQHKVDPQNLSLTSGTVYTCSVFAKKGSRDILQMIWSGAFGADRVNFDLTNGTTYGGSAATGKIESFGNGWYRCSITQAAGVNGLGRCQLLLQDSLSASRFASYQGNGSGNINIWGAMVEQQSYATSYIPTTGATATRVQEICTGAGNASTFNSTEGVLYAEIAALADDEINRHITLWDGTDTNRLVLKYDNQSNVVQVFNRVGGIETAFLGHNLADITISHKIAVRYKANDYALVIDGVKVDTDTSSSTWPASVLNNIKFSNGSGSDFYGKVNALQVYKEALSDAELEALTTI